MRRIYLMGIAWAVGMASGAPVAMAQSQAIARAVLQTIDFPGNGYVTETVSVTIAPRAVVPRHTHPGVEMGYLTSGAGTLSVDGQPVRTLKVGDSWAIPEGVAHALRNTGDQPEQIVATYVVERGKALASAVP